MAAPSTAGDARRTACEANIIPVVLGGASEPLDVVAVSGSPPGHPPSHHRPGSRMCVPRL